MICLSMGIFSPIARLQNWYARNERIFGSLSLVAGFIFDAVTLKRIDMFWENVWIISHLLVAGLGIIILNFYEKRRVSKYRDEEYEEEEGEKAHWTENKIHFWLIMFIQFAFGGLFSTFIVFYFRSATLATSWPFLALLAAVFIFNELFKRHYLRLTFQISVLFIATFSFAIYVVPVIFHRIGDDMFILSGLFSLILIWIFIRVLSFFTRERFRKSKILLFLSIGSIYIVINWLYFYNIIPPIPLSLKDAGVFHSIVKNSQGEYVVSFENRELDQKIIDFFRSSQTIKIQTGKTIYVYSAIFAPTNLKQDIFHVWQYYDDSKEQWIDYEKIGLSILGGRDEGFRTYSHSRNIFSGKWRVNIITPRGQQIGRIKFELERVESEVPLVSEIK